MSSQTVNIPRDTTLQDTNSKLQAIAEIIGGNPMIAEKFSTESSYAAGEYCINDGEFEKFTAAKTAGAWDASKATETTVGEELTALNNTLVQSITFTPNQGVTVQRNSMGCAGKLVSGTIEVLCSATANTWLSLGTMSKPPASAITVPCVRTGNGTHNGMVAIETTGEVRLYSTQVLSSNGVSFTFGYGIS